MDDLLKLIKNSVPLPAEDEACIIHYWTKTQTLSRGEALIEKGQVEQYLYFILEGTLRIYFPIEEDEICVGFGYPGTLICAFPSFIRNQASNYFIRAIKPCQLLKISKTDFARLREESFAMEQCWNLLVQEALLGKIERETEMLTFSPKERYHRLLQRSPHLFQVIPRKYIASYLRMKPETLSRISKK